MDGAINYSVGRHGRNHRHDVIVVQMLLNNHLAVIGPRPKLSVDGVCGLHTVNAIEAYQRYASHTEYADGVLYPHSQAVRRLLEHAAVMHTQLINTQLVKEVQATQKMQSPSTGPVANVDQVVPLPKPLAATLHTPETHVAAGAKQTGHKYTASGLEIPKAGTIVNPLLLPDLLQILART